VGRSSNRKKARRQGSQGSRKAGPGSQTRAVSGQISVREGGSVRWPGHSANEAPGLFGDGPRDSFDDGPDVATQRAMLQLLTALRAMTEMQTEHAERLAAARRAWCGGVDPVPAEVPSWPKDSLGDRILSGILYEARNAPSLLAAEVPDTAVITADPAHWNVASTALIRGAVFDGLQVDHPVVSDLLDMLAPVAEAELAYGEVIQSPVHRGWSELDEGDPHFPEDDGPVVLLGACALIDATWALVGTEPLGSVLPVLRSAVGEALPGLDRDAASDALLGAFARHYQCEGPGDAEILDRIGRDIPGDALEHLVATGVVPPADVLRTGLSLLSALAKLCMRGSASILDGSPEQGAA
jgi:hypothetical protein